MTMNRQLIFFILFWACVPPPPDPFIPPPTRQITDSPNSLTEGLLTEYDIWEFLKDSPNEANVISTLGLPDSVWVSDEQAYYILYYYRAHLKDYNSIELNKQERKVTGYEWDE